MFVCRLFCGSGAPEFPSEGFRGAPFSAGNRSAEDESRLDIWKISYYTIIIAT